MPVTLAELVTYTDKLLEVAEFADYCPNGLQVEGKPTVSRIVTGVTACSALIDAAIEAKADTLIVHHGYFWKGENASISGIKGRRIKKLLQHDMNLIAYHLPLDAHAELGNNVQLARLLDIEIKGGLNDASRPVGLVGELRAPLRADKFLRHIAERLHREPLFIGDNHRQIRKVAWCTGAAQSYIEDAALRNVDCFISGEISESTVHMARELDILFVAAGHHATERYGIKALGMHLSKQFSVECEFVDIDNPV